jgi:hypothetical protein
VSWRRTDSSADSTLAMSRLENPVSSIRWCRSSFVALTDSEGAGRTGLAMGTKGVAVADI